MDVSKLTKAITDLETAEQNLGSADANQQRAQGKFEEALAAKNTADSDDATAVVDFNAALDAVIAEATAAKVVRPPAV
jgi:hypothetical protein